VLCTIQFSQNKLTRVKLKTDITSTLSSKCHIHRIRGIYNHISHLHDKFINPPLQSVTELTTANTLKAILYCPTRQDAMTQQRATISRCLVSWRQAVLSGLTTSEVMTLQQDRNVYSIAVVIIKTHLWIILSKCFCNTNSTISKQDVYSQMISSIDTSLKTSLKHHSQSHLQ